MRKERRNQVKKADFVGESPFPLVIDSMGPATSKR